MIQYLSSIKSDHRGLYMVVSLEEFERGVGYWKLNTNLLTDMVYVNKMNEEIQKTLQSSTQKSPIERWEILKEQIKKFSTKYSRIKASERNLVISQLSERVNEYEAKPASR